jgi:L-ascorbate metabolism protein UlaG (beta-lactamase superfamily)
MLLTYFGHSTFRLEVAGQRLVFDPFLRANPHGSVDPATVPCDYVLCSHAHEDHIADALNLAKMHGATIVAPYELANHFADLGAKTIDLMPGGGVNLPWGRIQMTPAVHSSALELPKGENRAMGLASGYVVRAAGKLLYHAGDTGLFGDMQLIGRHGLDVALIPIGDFYTMGPDDAVEALRLLRPKLAVPMHYNTFPPIRQDPQAFAAAAAKAGHAVRVMGAGEAISL